MKPTAKFVWIESELADDLAVELHHRDSLEVGAEQSLVLVDVHLAQLDPSELLPKAEDRLSGLVAEVAVGTPVEGEHGAHARASQER